MKNFPKSKLSLVVSLLVSGGGALLIAQQASAFSLTINDSTGNVTCSADNMSIDTSGNVTINSGSGCLTASTGTTTTTTTTTTSGGPTTSTSSTSSTATTTATTTTTAAPSPTAPPTATCADPLSGGVDRGCETWTPTDADVTVFTGNYNTQRNYIPSCVAQGPKVSSFTSCYSRGSVQPGEIYSMRIPFRGGSRSRYAMSMINAAGIAAEYAAFDAAISTTPGSKIPLDSLTECATDASANRTSLYVGDKKTLNSFYKFTTCKLNANAVYYLNIWPAEDVSIKGVTAADCAKSSVDCRIMLDNGLFGKAAADRFPLTSDLVPNFY